MKKKENKQTSLNETHFISPYFPVVFTELLLLLRVKVELNTRFLSPKLRFVHATAMEFHNEDFLWPYYGFKNASGNSTS